jgi:DNA-binding beta-propeller fold protein YncE
VNLSSILVPRFDEPTAIAVTESDVWVVNMAGNSITEFNAKTGSLIRVLNAKADAFHHPDGIAIVGSHLWITNGNEEFGMGTSNYPLAKYSSVTELNASNGSLVRVLTNRRDQFLEPGPIASSSSHIWVLNANSAQGLASAPMNALIELNASNGSLVHIFKTNVDDLYGALNLTATRSDVWVTNANGYENSVTELNANNGSLVRVLRSNGNLVAPDSVAVSGGRVWIANIRDTNNAITEFNSSDGSFIREIKAKGDRFGGLFGIAAAGSHVWVTNSDAFNQSVTELNASNGSLDRVIKAKADDFHDASSIVALGTKLWVLNGDSVTELNASTGSLIRVVK